MKFFLSFFFRDCVWVYFFILEDDGKLDSTEDLPKRKFEWILIKMIKSK